MELTRRRLLGGLAGTAATAGTAAASDQGTTSGDRILRRFVVPSVEEFEGDYQGQFVFVQEATDGTAEDVPVGECAFADWSPDDLQVYDGQLLDRRQEAPIAVDLPVYADGGSAEISPATHFIIQSVRSCPGDYVGLQAEWVTRQALAGKPPGPTVAKSDAQTPGFGLLAGSLSVAGGLLARAVYRRRS